MTVTNLRAERDKRNRQKLVVEAQRRRHDRQVRQQRRAVANGAAGGCLTTITATLATGVALVAVAWKAGRR